MEFTYLLECKTEDGLYIVFQADECVLAQAGDYVEHDGDLFEVTSVCHVRKDSDIYQLIDNAAGIKKAERLLSTIWEVKK